MGQSDSNRQYQSGLIRDVGTARSLSRADTEVPSTAASVAGKASARPELENSQGPKADKDRSGFFAAQIYH
jgi:hypothetical protein